MAGNDNQGRIAVVTGASITTTATITRHTT
jgi:hypothetical protein